MKRARCASSGGGTGGREASDAVSLRNCLVLAATAAVLLVSEPVSALLCASEARVQQPCLLASLPKHRNGNRHRASGIGRRFRGENGPCGLVHRSHRQQNRNQELWYAARSGNDNSSDDDADEDRNKTGMSIKKQREVEFNEFVEAHGDDLDSLRAQAAKLRAEADSLRTNLDEAREARLQKETDKVDGWIEDLLIRARVGGGDGDTEPIELLNTVDQVTEVLRDDRYSAEQVLKIFRRLSQLRDESRSNCSPLMELLVDATGKLDGQERADNPNKRWNHKVERVLRKKLFARDWNIQYVSEDEENW